MARKSKSTPTEDITNIVALMPWWAGVVLAAIAYFWLHSVATTAVVISTMPGQVATSALPAVWKGLATVGQYVLPLLCLLGAAMSAYRRSQRTNLVTNVSDSTATDALDGMTWQEFELLVGESFRLQGYQVTETGGGGADGGIDLVLRKGNEKFLVQCKQWKAFTVGVTVVRELFGVMAAKGATGGFVVTSGKYTKDAMEFAKGRNVELIDGPSLLKMINAAQVNRERKEPTLNTNAPARTPISNPAIPACPVCSKAMVQRTAKKGAKAGQTFWGCSGYPACKGTRPAG
jgi:restriction system protein